MITFDEIASIEEVEEDECWDITLFEEDVFREEPNFVADGVLVHNCGMGDRYTHRKRGEEQYFLHPVLEPILGNTYGIMVYQEQVMKILHAVGLIPEIHCEKVRKAISKKKVKAFIKYKNEFLVNGQKTLTANLDFVEEMWKQIESFAEYGFNKSHATAYCFISSRLLWLKTYYPLEFYTAILMCEKDTDKLKDYRRDAFNHGIEIHPVDINKSGKNFKIVDGKIYFGFSNIKGIGKTAEKIVKGQPYKNFEDFLDRCGTASAFVKPLVSLGVFGQEHDRLTLFKFCEHYKIVMQKRRLRQNRFEERMEEYPKLLADLLLTEVTTAHPDWEKMCQFTDEARELWSKHFAEVKREVPFMYKGEQRTRTVTLEKQLNNLCDKWEGTQRLNKEKLGEDEAITMERFDSSRIKIDAAMVKVLTNRVMHKGKAFYPEAEREFYGFQWISNVERSPLYRGFTIDRFLQKAHAQSIASEKDIFGTIEVEIKAVTPRKSRVKPGSGRQPIPFYNVDVEDANAKAMTVNLWEDDYLRFREDLVKGTLVRMEVKPPTGGYKTMTLNAPPKHLRAKKLPKNREDDLRLVVLPPGDSENVDLVGFSLEE